MNKDVDHVSGLTGIIQDVLQRTRRSEENQDTGDKQNEDVLESIPGRVKKSNENLDGNLFVVKGMRTILVSGNEPGLTNVDIIKRSMQDEPALFRVKRPDDLDKTPFSDDEPNPKRIKRDEATFRVTRTEEADGTPASGNELELTRVKRNKRSILGETPLFRVTRTEEANGTPA